MRIEQTDTGGVVVFQLVGSFDTNSSPEVETRLLTAIDDGATKCVINFAQVDYVSSNGLRVLIASAKRLRGAGGDLRLANLNASAREVFDISGFSRLFKVFDAESDAVGSF